MKNILFIIILGLVFYSPLKAKKKNYFNAKFNVSPESSKIVAILPFQDDREGNKKDWKEAYTLNEEESNYFQMTLNNKFSSVFDNSESIDFQDLNETNALLRKHRINEENIDNYSYQQLAKFLKVDAVLSWDFLFIDPYSNYRHTILSFYGPASEFTSTIRLYDGETGDLIWQFKKKKYVPSTRGDITKYITFMARKASRNIRYSHSHNNFLSI